MSERKVFCERCRNDVVFTVTDNQMNGTIKGKMYTYLGKTAHCADCGSDLYVKEINDYNLMALYNKYREKYGIVSVDTILKISEKYAIGRRPLSLLLGWGEHTISRYCDGDIPIKQYSDILKKIYNEPVYYNQILERNKANLKSQASYKKSKQAVIVLLNRDVCL